MTGEFAAEIARAALAFTIGAAVAPWLNPRYRRAYHRGRHDGYHRGYRHGEARGRALRTLELFDEVRRTIDPADSPPPFDHERFQL